MVGFREEDARDDRRRLFGDPGDRPIPLSLAQNINHGKVTTLFQDLTELSALSLDPSSWALHDQNVRSAPIYSRRQVRISSEKGNRRGSKGNRETRWRI